MARRATLFSKYAHDKNTLRIAGPYEFTRGNIPGPARNPENAPLIAGYCALNYSLGILAPGESDIGRVLKSENPDIWMSLSEVPLGQTLGTDSGRVTVVVFPADKKTGTPTEKMLQELQNTLTQLYNDPRNQLIVGISPWGKKYEQAFLTNHPGLCDILLGSGPGPGLTSSLSHDRRTMWVRAYSKGRTVSRIQVERFPVRVPVSTWSDGQTIKARLMLLNEKVQANPEMQKIFAPRRSVGTPSKSRNQKSSCGQ